MLASAFLLGLVGSLHCLGMCGPIALALPTAGAGRWGILVYNFGRILTYSFIGLILGVIGMTITVAGFQQGLSLVIGLALILSLALPRKANIAKWPLITKFTEAVKRRLKIEFQKKQKGSLFAIGLLNGFLPCGLVYVALAAATTASQWYWGVFYMALFGLGTVPMMVAISGIRRVLTATGMIRVNRIIPVFVFILGCLFVLRGLNLGIPYLSPDLNDPAHHHHHQATESRWE